MLEMPTVDAKFDELCCAWIVACTHVIYLCSLRVCPRFFVCFVVFCRRIWFDPRVARSALNGQDDALFVQFSRMAGLLDESGVKLRTKATE